jgi:hypothetical protein
VIDEQVTNRSRKNLNSNRHAAKYYHSRAKAPLYVHEQLDGGVLLASLHVQACNSWGTTTTATATPHFTSFLPIVSCFLNIQSHTKVMVAGEAAHGHSNTTKALGHQQVTTQAMLA